MSNAHKSKEGSPTGAGRSIAGDASVPQEGRSGAANQARTEAVPSSNRSGQVPEGDVRLTANIRGDLHLKLKIKAAQERTTIGELIERWIENWR